MVWGRSRDLLAEVALAPVIVYNGGPGGEQIARHRVHWVRLEHGESPPPIIHAGTVGDAGNDRVILSGFVSWIAQAQGVPEQLGNIGDLLGDCIGARIIPC